MKTTLAIAVILAVMLAGPATAQEVGVGSEVTMDYVLLEGGKELTRTDDPVTFTVGNNQVLPDLQKGMLGMKKGDTRSIKLTPEQAFGEVDPELIGEVPLSSLPEDGRKVGAVLSGKGPDGKPVMAQVVEIKGDKAVVDGNHPWAGKTLTFKVTVAEVHPKK